LAGSVLALPIVLKVTPLAPVGVLVFEQLVASWFATARSRALPRASACAGGVVFGLVLALLLVPASLVGWRANLDHLDTWWHSVAARNEDSTDDRFAGDSASARNQSFTNAVCRLGNWTSYYFAGGPHDDDPTEQRKLGERFVMDAPLVNGLLLAARVAAGCLLLAVGYRTARSRDALQLAAAFGLACVSTLILSPIARGHYYVLLFPATMFVSAWLVRQRRPGWAVCSAVVPAALTVAHYTLLGVAGRIGLLGIGTTVWYVAACVAIVRMTSRASTPAELPINVRWDPSSQPPAWRTEREMEGVRDTAPTIS
jgi:hypothetical protein